jgi:hypothetical protein
MSYNSGGRIVSDGLVLYLDAANRKSFVSGSSTWFDLSRNNNSGSLNNTPTFSTDAKGSILFDGTNESVSRASVNVSYLTVDVWAKWTQFFSDPNGHALVSNSDTDTGDPINGYLLYQATGAPYNRVQAFVYGTSLTGLTSVSTLSTGVWYNITFTYDGSATRLYLNGRLDTGSNVAVGTIAASSANFLIGSTYTAGNSAFSGNVSNIKLYNRALSATEILNNYNVTKKRFGL